MADDKITAQGSPSTLAEGTQSASMQKFTDLAAGTPSASMQQITGTLGLGLEGMPSALMQQVATTDLDKGMPNASMTTVPTLAPAPAPAPAPASAPALAPAPADPSK